ncbi:MAG: O-methyltransferase [Acidobacteria bacterium]|nr:O-methyltransferase [Acidobacteriota bacterium]
MFLEIPEVIQRRMSHLEDRDRLDRVDGTSHLERLRQIPRDTGRFLALLAASAPPGAWIEIGTSAGYSSMWLALAARERATSLTTFEILAVKAALAADTFSLTGLDDVVSLVHGDFLDHVSELGDIGFCFLDAEKDVYDQCYDAVVSRLAPGGLLVADNAISHEIDLRPVIEKALDDPRVDAVVVPIGKGELLCRRKSGPA